MAAGRAPAIRMAARMHGVLVIDKPPGLTSHDVVARVRRATGLRRIGHTGTLDPIATGVLPLVLGQATRLAALLSATTKTYEAVFRLGVVTDTYDLTGNVSGRPHPRSDGGQGEGEPAWRAGPQGEDQVPPGDSRTAHLELRIDIQAIEAARSAFLGTFWQRPPSFSAKKIGGVRAYTLARRGRPVEPKPVKVTVHEFEILSFKEDHLRCRLTCSPGFYVRALAHELGGRLGCGACLETLRREWSAGFGLDAAVPLDVVSAEGAAVLSRVIPLSGLLPDLPTLELTDRGARRAGHGNAVLPDDVRAVLTPVSEGGARSMSALPPGKVKLLDHRGALIAIADMAPGGFLHPTIVLG